MDDSRCIILGIDALDRITYDRLAQIAINITLAHTLIDGIFQTTADKMHILSDLHKDNCHTGILADGNGFLVCDREIFLQLLQNLFAQRRFFFFCRNFQCLIHVL